MNICITGGAGCIGSELAAALVSEGHQVLVVDNLSSGRLEHIKNVMPLQNFRFVRASLLDRKAVHGALKGTDAVFHLAANPHIKYKPGDPTDRDLRLNTIATYNVLEAMRLNGVSSIVFSSSSAVYGEAKKAPTPEEYPFEPISLYGASKAACESLIAAYCHMFGFRSWIFRFGNVVGGKSRKTGTTVITDFIEKLRKNPKELEILGDGRQSKSYMLVDDCVAGMLYGFREAKDNVNVFNLSSGDSISVTEISRIVISELGLSGVKTIYTGGDRGWPGDVPKVLLSINRMKKLGWKPKHTSKGAVTASVRQMLGKA